MSSATRTDLVLRPAVAEDAEEMAAVQLAARSAAPMPDPLHPRDQVRRWLRSRIGVEEIWVAETGGDVVGYARFTRTWLDDLYVHPDHAGTGIGGALLELVQSLRPDGFGLWVFERNTPARSFYAARGFAEVAHTDGAENEEGEPDIRLAWGPTGGWSGIE